MSDRTIAVEPGAGAYFPLTLVTRLPTIRDPQFAEPTNCPGMTTPLHRGLRHLALRVLDLPRSRRFYEQLLGFQSVWEPDPENIYFSSGIDNLALHQISKGELGSYDPSKTQLLDHMGVILDSPQAVDQMYREILPKLESLGGRIAKEPKQHRDGSYSFYFSDPDGNLIQALYEPAISKLRISAES